MEKSRFARLVFSELFPMWPIFRPPSFAPKSSASQEHSAKNATNCCSSK